MNIIGNERLLDKLAAEYVLGTLKGGARRRYEDWLHAEPLVQRVTAQWQERLGPMAQFAPEVTPRPEVWRSIAAELELASLARSATTTATATATATANTAANKTATAGTPLATAQAADAAAGNTRSPKSTIESKRAFWRGLRDDLGFWRGLGMASTALATILVAVLATRGPAADVAAPNASYVAMLADDKAQPVALVTGDEARHRLVVKVVAPQQVAADKSLQLWAVPKSGAPRSLGLVAGDGTITLPLPAGASPQTVGLLAISLEPKGGSPNPNAPTGPIVYKGSWLSL